MEKFKDRFDFGKYVHNPYDNYYEKGKHVKGFRYRYIFIWIAFTPTRKVSKYYHAELSKKWKTTNFYPLPKLKKGYMWSGPYLLSDYSETCKGV